MKRLQTLFLALLIVCSGFGQTVLRSNSTVLRAYDSYQPLHIETSCEVWFDGKDDQSFTLDGTSVDQWDDKSGNARHVLNTNADATRPTYDINTGRVTFIDANSTFLQSALFGAALSQPNTVFVVYKITGVLSNTGVVVDFRDNVGNYIYHTLSTYKMYAQTVLTDGTTDANTNIHACEFNGVSSEYWINGASIVSGNAGTSTIKGITLGIFQDLALYAADIEICEVIVFNADISNVDRDKITGYLGWKWKIPSTTNFHGYILYSD